ncbi:hypothetical protein ACIB24_04245 [Spongisporangium articulatum]|uniref:Uncharacterized protein n=1 Tax=Spongisporangium articulatum TaxID=3362603 RepID=A0ABW8AIS8_9ACTN
MNTHLGAAGTLAAALTIITLGYLLWYLLLCWIKPFGVCWRCGGDGELVTWLGTFVGYGRGKRTCTRCHHTGRRLRIGRKIINHFRGIRTEAHRATDARTGPRAPGQHRPGTTPPNHDRNERGQR